jgi:hypothetical protein
MAFPLILIDSATGSDTAASGAGPATAVTGTKGRTRNTATQTRVGFFETTPPDLSGVATDGSHVLYIAISTSGARNFSSINAAKNTQQTDTGNMTATSAVVSSIGSTSGWSVGDVIKVAGAGAAGVDLYSTILTVDSANQVTLNDAASTTVVGAAVVNPRQVGLTSGEGLNTGTTDTTWAIGGKRASLCSNANSRKLITNNGGAGDAMPGWTMQFASGHTETTSAVDMGIRTGTTAGAITIQGEPGAAVLPIITSSANGGMFYIGNAVAYVVFQDFEVRNTNATKTASVAFTNVGSNGRYTLRRIKCNHTTDKFWKFTTANHILDMDGCDVGSCANIAVTLNANFTHRISNCYIHDSGSHGISITSGAVLLDDCIIADNGGDGINVTANNGTFASYLNCTITGNAGDGFESNQSAANLERQEFRNIIFSSNGGYGINLTAAGLTAAALKTRRTRFIGNMFGSGSAANTSGKYNISGLDSENETTGNPNFADPANHNYAPGSALAGQAHPSGVAGKRIGQTSSTATYRAPGAAQRNDWATPSLVVGF